MKKLLIVVLIFLTMNFYLTRIAVAQQVYTGEDVPEHAPQTWFTPEIDFPGMKARDKVSVSKMWWILLGLAVVAGAAVAAGGHSGGSGGGTDSGTDSGTGSDTGDVSIGW